MIQIVEHAPHEGPYAIRTALAAAGLPVRVCRTWAGDPVPDTADDLVALVVMGGAMAAYEDFPSRTAELVLLRAALEAGVPVLGVCLGAQLPAVAAGGAARPGGGAQIGWRDVRMNEAAHDDPLFAAVPERVRVLHWHSDTMDLPAGATLLASRDRHPVQAFRIGGWAWGMQFHLEVDEPAVEAFAQAFPEEAATAPGLVESAPRNWPPWHVTATACSNAFHPPAAPNAPPATAAPSTRTTPWPRSTWAPPCGRPAGTSPAMRTPGTTS